MHIELQVQIFKPRPVWNVRPMSYNALPPKSHPNILASKICRHRDPLTYTSNALRIHSSIKIQS